MSYSTIVLAVLMLAVFHQVYAEMPPVDESFYLPWSVFYDRIVNHNFRVVGSIDYRAPVTNIPLFNRVRCYFQTSKGPTMSQNILRSHFALWNGDRDTCFHTTLTFTKGPEAFANLINHTPGPFGTMLKSERRFISSYPEEYVILVLGFGWNDSGGCYDGAVAIAVHEQIYDANGDGELDEGKILPLDHMNADIRNAFNLPEDQVVVQGWPDEGMPCPIPSA